jgi:glycosyl hydrolase family 47
MVGGLLSGHLATGERVLLDKARDLTDRLMPAFEKSPTGAPYRFVNLRTGAVSGNENFLAEVGTNITELGTLSRLTGDRRYYVAAKKALKAAFDRRSKLDLVGTTLNIETGACSRAVGTSEARPPLRGLPGRRAAAVPDPPRGAGSRDVPGHEQGQPAAPGVRRLCLQAVADDARPLLPGSRGRLLRPDEGHEPATALNATGRIGQLGACQRPPAFAH